MEHLQELNNLERNLEGLNGCLAWVDRSDIDTHPVTRMFDLAEAFNMWSYIANTSELDNVYAQVRGIVSGALSERVSSVKQALAKYEIHKIG